jgi:hypothetical protein
VRIDSPLVVAKTSAAGVPRVRPVTSAHLGGAGDEGSAGGGDRHHRCVVVSDPGDQHVVATERRRLRTLRRPAGGRRGPRSTASRRTARRTSSVAPPSSIASSDTSSIWSGRMMRVRRGRTEPLRRVFEFLEHDACAGAARSRGSSRSRRSGRELGRLLLELELLQRGEPAQLHVEDVARLDVAQRQLVHESGLASAASCEERMIEITRSIASSAISRPSTMCSRSRARPRRYSVRRRTTSRRCSA